MVIPEGGVGSCLALGVLEAHSVKQLADRVIGEPGFFGVDFKQMVHSIFFFLTGAISTQKNICPSIYTRPIPFTTEVVMYLLCAERGGGSGALEAECSTGKSQPPSRRLVPRTGAYAACGLAAHEPPLSPFPTDLRYQGDKHKSPCPVDLGCQGHGGVAVVGRTHAPEAGKNQRDTE